MEDGVIEPESALSNSGVLEDATGTDHPEEEVQDAVQDVWNENGVLTKRESMGVEDDAGDEAKPDGTISSRGGEDESKTEGQVHQVPLDETSTVADRSVSTCDGSTDIATEPQVQISETRNLPHADIHKEMDSSSLSDKEIRPRIDFVNEEEVVDESPLLQFMDPAMEELPEDGSKADAVASTTESGELTSLLFDHHVRSATSDKEFFSEEKSDDVPSTTESYEAAALVEDAAVESVALDELTDNPSISEHTSSISGPVDTTMVDNEGEQPGGDFEFLPKGEITASELASIIATADTETVMEDEDVDPADGGEQPSPATVELSKESPNVELDSRIESGESTVEDGDVEPSPEEELRNGEIVADEMVSSDSNLAEDRVEDEVLEPTASHEEVPEETVADEKASPENFEDSSAIEEEEVVGSTANVEEFSKEESVIDGIASPEELAGASVLVEDGVRLTTREEDVSQEVTLADEMSSPADSGLPKAIEEDTDVELESVDEVTEEAGGASFPAESADASAFSGDEVVMETVEGLPHNESVADEITVPSYPLVVTDVEDENDVPVPAEAEVSIEEVGPAGANEEDYKDKSVRDEIASPSELAEGHAGAEDELAGPTVTEAEVPNEVSVADESSYSVDFIEGTTVPVEDEGLEPAAAHDDMMEGTQEITSGHAGAEDELAGPTVREAEVPNEVSVADESSYSVDVIEGTTVPVEDEGLEPAAAHEDKMEGSQEMASLSKVVGASDAVDYGGEQEKKLSKEMDLADESSAEDHTVPDIVQNVDLQHAQAYEKVAMDDTVADQLEYPKESTDAAGGVGGVGLLASEEDLPTEGSVADDLVTTPTVEGRDVVPLQVDEEESMRECDVDGMAFPTESTNPPSVEDEVVQDTPAEVDHTEEASIADEITSTADSIADTVSVEDEKVGPTSDLEEDTKEASTVDERDSQVDVADATAVVDDEDVGDSTAIAENEVVGTTPIEEDLSMETTVADGLDSAADSGEASLPAEDEEMDPASCIKEDTKEESAIDEEASQANAADETVFVEDGDVGHVATKEEVSEEVIMAGDIPSSTDSREIDITVEDENLEPRRQLDLGPATLDNVEAIAVEEQLAKEERVVDEISSEASLPVGASVVSDTDVEHVTTDEEVQPAAPEEELMKEDTVAEEIASGKGTAEAATFVENEGSPRATGIVEDAGSLSEHESDVYGVWPPLEGARIELTTGTNVSGPDASPIAHLVLEPPLEGFELEPDRQFSGKSLTLEACSTRDVVETLDGNLNGDISNDDSSEKVISADESQFLEIPGNMVESVDKGSILEPLSPKVLSIVTQLHEETNSNNNDKFSNDGQHLELDHLGTFKALTSLNSEQPSLQSEKGFSCYASCSSEDGSSFIDLKEVTEPEEVAEKHVVLAHWSGKPLASVTVSELEDNSYGGPSMEKQCVPIVVTLEDPEASQNEMSLDLNSEKAEQGILAAKAHYSVPSSKGLASDDSVMPKEVADTSALTGANDVGETPAITHGGGATHLPSRQSSQPITAFSAGLKAVHDNELKSDTLEGPSEEDLGALHKFPEDEVDVAVPLSTPAVDLSSSWVSVPPIQHAETQLWSHDSPTSFSQRSQLTRPADELGSGRDGWKVVSEQDTSQIVRPDSSDKPRDQNPGTGSSGSMFPFSIVLWCSQSMSSLFGRSK